MNNMLLKEVIGEVQFPWLGFDHSNNCKGIHINMLPTRHIDGPKTEEENLG